jgi:tartrate-resistant acid phosphatase type 5
MTRRLSCLCGALTLFVACADDGDAGTGSGPTSQVDPTTGVASADPPVTTGGTPPGDTGIADEGSASMSASQSTTAPATSTPDPTTGGTVPDPDTTSPPDPSTTAPDPDTTSPATTSDDSTTGPGETGVVRFAALGDTGEGNENQYMVAAAIVDVCADKGGCDFAMLLGDNFYDSGVSGVDDPQWQEKFEMPYADFTFPIYVALGNHDYGGNGIGVDFDTDKSDYQVQYTNMSDLWTLPDEYYSFKLQHAEFWGLDTNQVMTDPINGDSEPQQEWLENGLAASTATWKIAFGHHPYISNGDHGNAGAYENLEGIPLPFVTGESVKEFMEAAVCGKADVYLSGHDHNIQWLEPACGTEFIVSGAGSKSEGLPGDNPAYFGMPETEGFILVELVDDSFTGTFYDKTGKQLFTKTIVK